MFCEDIREIKCILITSGVIAIGVSLAVLLIPLLQGKIMKK